MISSMLPILCFIAKVDYNNEVYRYTYIHIFLLYIRAVHIPLGTKLVIVRPFKENLVIYNIFFTASLFICKYISKSYNPYNQSSVNT